MMQTKPPRKLVRAQTKGQVTIPREFRRALGIEGETLLSISLVGDHLEIAPLRPSEDALRRYTEEDVARFLEEDKLDGETARRIRQLRRRTREFSEQLRRRIHEMREGKTIPGRKRL